MTPERLREIGRAICQSRTCEGFECCQWPANLARRHKCPVDNGGYDDAARAIAPLIEAARAEGQKGMQERCRQAALKRRDVWLNDLENGKYRTYACCLEEECQDLADIIAALPIDGANQIQNTPVDAEPRHNAACGRTGGSIPPTGATSEAKQGAEPFGYLLEKSGIDTGYYFLLPREVATEEPRFKRLYKPVYTAPPAPDREAVARAIYLAMYQHEGGRWECHETKEVWYEIADRFGSLLGGTR